MRFDVPQFIDVEDKIFGPLTFKQFAYIAGGGGIIFTLWKLLPIYAAIIPIIIVGVLAGALAFIKVNNRPFVEILESAFNFFFRDKLYIWKKDEQKQKKKEDVVKKTPTYVPTLSGSKLHDVAWGLDVLDRNNRTN